MDKRTLNVRFIRKDPSSGLQGCPSLYEVDGGHVVVGKRLGAAELADVLAVAEEHNSGIADDEIAVWLPAGVIHES